MSKRLMPTYLVNFLKEIYDGTIPSNFGERMVSRQFIASVKTLYETLGGDNPSDYSRRMVNEYLIKFFNEIEIVEYTDDDVLMTKTISSDLVYPACRVDAIGGMSYKSENLLNIPDVSETTDNGITYKIENGLLTLNGTATNSSYVVYNNNLDLTLKANTTYAINLFANYNMLFFDAYNNNVINVTGQGTYTPTQDVTIKGMRRFENQGGSFDNVVLKPMIVSGSTAPSEYKPYFAGIRDSAVTAVKTYNTDNELLDTYTVPSTITSLEGYGQSNPDDPTELNVVDFVAGKYYEKGYIDNGVWVSKEDEISITEQAPLLECEDSGTIVFENTYNQDMPNGVTTWIKGN